MRLESSLYARNGHVSVLLLGNQLTVQSTGSVGLVESDWQTQFAVDAQLWRAVHDQGAHWDVLGLVSVGIGFGRQSCFGQFAQG